MGYINYNLIIIGRRRAHIIYKWRQAPLVCYWSFIYFWHRTFPVLIKHRKRVFFVRHCWAFFSYSSVECWKSAQFWPLACRRVCNQHLSLFVLLVQAVSWTNQEILGFLNFSAQISGKCFPSFPTVWWLLPSHVVFWPKCLLRRYLVGHVSVAVQSSLFVPLWWSSATRPKRTQLRAGYVLCISGPFLQLWNRACAGPPGTMFALSVFAPRSQLGCPYQC